MQWGWGRCPEEGTRAPRAGWGFCPFPGKLWVRRGHALSFLPGGTCVGLEKVWLSSILCHVARGSPCEEARGSGAAETQGMVPLEGGLRPCGGSLLGQEWRRGAMRLGEDSAHSGVSHTRHSGPCVCQRHSARPLSHWQEKLSVGSSHPRGDAPLGQPGDPGRALSCGSHDPALGLGSASLPVSWVQHCLLQNRFLSFVVNNSCFFSP